MNCSAGQAAWCGNENRVRKGHSRVPCRLLERAPYTIVWRKPELFRNPFSFWVQSVSIWLAPNMLNTPILLLSVAVLGLVSRAHGWVTVSPQGRVTIKAETQIGYATMVLIACGAWRSLRTPANSVACVPVFQALGTSRGGRPSKVAVRHRRRKCWARSKQRKRVGKHDAYRHC